MLFVWLLFLNKLRHFPDFRRKTRRLEIYYLFEGDAINHTMKETR